MTFRLTDGKIGNQVPGGRYNPRADFDPRSLLGVGMLEWAKTAQGLLLYG